LETARILGGLAGWFLQAQFVFESLVSLAMLFSAAGIVYALAIGPEPIKNFARLLTPNKKMLLGVVGAAIFILFILAVALPWRKDHLMYTAYNSKLPARAPMWNNFARVTPMGTGFDSFIILNGIESAYEKNIDDLAKEQPNTKKIVTQELDAIASYLYNESGKHPYGFEQSLLGAKFFYLRMSANNDFNGEPFELATELADRALKLSPTNPEAYWIAAKIQFAAKNYTEAKDLLEQAFALAPASRQTNQLILALATATKDQAYYDMALARAKQNIPNF
jgi:tetratricopeptide (TPR) repeat protein